MYSFSQFVTCRCKAGLSLLWVRRHATHDIHSHGFDSSPTDLLPCQNDCNVIKMSKPVVHIGENIDAVRAQVREHVISVLSSVASPVLALSGGSAADIIADAFAAAPSGMAWP